MKALPKLSIMLGLILALVQAPAVSAASDDLVLPKLQDATLKGGFKVRMLERHDLPLVTLVLRLRGGSAADPVGQEGLADFVGEMLRKGAGARNAQQLALAVDSMGATLDTQVDRDSTVITLEVLNRDVPAAVSLLADLVMRPTFPADEVDRTRSRILAQIKDIKDDPREATSQFFYDQLYRGHPYGHPVIGYERTVGGVQRADLLKFHQGVYRPENAWLAVLGDFKPAELKKALTQAFESWPKTASAHPALALTLPPAPAPFKGQQVVVVNRPELTQVQIRIGNLGFAAGDPREIPLAAANTALGGSFGARLNEEIRVNRSLSYGANSGFRAFQEPGPFTISTFTKNATVAETIKVALDTVRTFKQEGLKEGELERARAYAAGQFVQGVQTPEALGAALTRLELYHLPLEHLTKYATRLKAISAADARAVLPAIPSEDVLIVLYADKSRIEDQLKDFKNVTVLESGEWKAPAR